MNIEKEISRLHTKSYAWAVQNCQFDEEMAKDVLQESYMKVLEKHHSFQAHASFKTWLFTIIRNTALDFLRKKGRRLKLVGRVPVDEIYEEWPIHENKNAKQKMIQQFLRQLSPKQQDVLSLVFYHEFTIEEAADIMKVSLGSARTHYTRGKENLKKLIQKSRIQQDA